MKRITYLGQNGFIVEWNGTEVAFDLYLSDCVREQTGSGIRNYDAPVPATELTGLTYYFISHEHLDHLDPITVRKVGEVNAKVRFVCPLPLTQALMNLNIPKERIIPAKAGCTLELDNGIMVYPIPQKHEDFVMVDNEHAVLGYVVEKDGFRIYHAGDVVADRELAEKLKAYGPMDIMFVPINGHDWKRYAEDIMGNMNYREALDLCDYVGTDMVVPMHYDLFDNNTENPAYFVDYLYRNYPNQKFKMFMPGESIWIP